MDQRQRVAAAFDAAADTYDQVGVAWFQPIADRLVYELAPAPGERILDIGCGRGAVLIPVGAAVGGTGEAVGLDLAPNMVAAAEREARLAAVRVTVRVGDAQEPDLPAGSFDAITASLVLFFLPDPAAALRRWRDLLVPGGRIAVSTFGDYTPGWRRVDEVFTPYLPPDIRDARTSGTKGPFASDHGVERLFADAGFTTVRTVRAEIRARFDSPEHWQRWMMSLGQRQFWAFIPESERDQVRDRVFAAVEQTGRDNADGRIGFDQQVRYTLGRR